MNIDVLWNKYSLPDYPNGKRSMSRSRFVQAIGEIISSPLDALVSLPAVQINEITHGDSLELTGCVPAKADLILEDMPYNTTACDWDKEPIDLQKYWETRLRLIKPTGVICLTASQPFTTDLIMSNRGMFKYEWIWKKNRVTNVFMGRKQPLKAHENICVFYNHQPTYNPQMEARAYNSHTKGEQVIEGRGIYEGSMIIAPAVKKGDLSLAKSVQEFKSVHTIGKDRTLHPTQKPVGLFEYLIRTYTNEGDLVFDGFGGSGTTAIAAYRTKRNFIVIEKDKRYFEIASKRLYQERNPLSTFDEAS